jgi:hypothetical protein
MNPVRLLVRRSAVSLAFVLGLTYFQSQSGVFAQNIPPMNAHPSPEKLEEAKRYIEMASTSAKVNAYISNYTRMTYDPRHGTQVEYNAPNGESYLWYPGRVPDQTHRYVTLCYLYSAASYDPTNNSRGGKWECVPSVLAIIRTKERTAGNPFRLGASRQTPFILPPDETDLASLMKQIRR